MNLEKPSFSSSDVAAHDDQRGQRGASQAKSLPESVVSSLAVFTKGPVTVLPLPRQVIKTNSLSTGYGYPQW